MTDQPRCQTCSRIEPGMVWICKKPYCWTCSISVLREMGFVFSKKNDVDKFVDK